MAVCLDYQTAYVDKPLVLSARLQLCVTLILLVVLLTKVWVKVSGTNLGYQLAAEQSRTVNLSNERQEYEFKLSVIKREDNLARLAEKKLNLSIMKPGQIWRVEMN